VSEHNSKSNEPKLIAEFKIEELRGKKLHVDLAGLPGIQQQLSLQVHVPDPKDPLKGDSPLGQAGNYRVVFTLSRPGFSLLPDDSYADAASMQGDSHLAIAKPAHPHPNLPENTHVKVTSDIAGNEITFNCYPNEKGFLGKVELPSIEAQSFGDAALKAFQGLTPVLSSMSFRYEVPLNIYQVDVIELRTGSNRLTIVKAFQETPFLGDPTRLLDLEFLKYASYYREGLNNNNPSYQFLCFYKIIEGIRERRARRIQEAKQKSDLIPPPDRQRIPKEAKNQIEWLNSISFLKQRWDDVSLSAMFPDEVVGRTIGDLIDKKSELHKTRLKIAHAVLESGEPTLSIDDAFDIQHINKWLPLTKCIARHLLNVEFPDKFPDESPKAGTVRLYRSRRFSSRTVGDHLEYDAEAGSLEHVRDLVTEIKLGKVTMPSFDLDMESEGIGEDDAGDPKVIYVGMELHGDGSEHLLFTGYFHTATATFRIYGTRR